MGGKWAEVVLTLFYPSLRSLANTDRGDRIRTCDLVLPKHKHEPSENGKNLAITLISDCIALHENANETLLKVAFTRSCV